MLPIGQKSSGCTTVTPLVHAAKVANSLVKDVVLQEDHRSVPSLAGLAQLHKAGLDVPAGATCCLVEVHNDLHKVLLCVPESIE